MTTQVYTTHFKQNGCTCERGIQKQARRCKSPVSEATSHEKTIYMAQSSKGNCGYKNGSNKTGYLIKKN